MVACLLGAILPEDTDKVALKETNRWLVFYLYIPVGIQVIFMISLLLIIKYEPIKFLIDQGRNEEAMYAVKQMYKYAIDDETA